MAKENTGGRKKFRRGTRVRYLTMDGRISDDIYLIDPGTGEEDEGEYVRSDRKGHITLRQEGGTRELKVHFRRVLPLEIDGKAPVIESSDKYRAICPKCGRVKDISPGEDKLQCSTNCGEFPLHWLGAKPMADAATKDTKSAEAADKASKPAAKPKSDKKTSKPAAREPVRVDFDALKGLDNCELWTKKNVKFDHVDVDVQAHALLYVEGDQPRKLCFNTYDGVLGKKSPPLPIDEFVADTEVKNAKRAKPWFPIKDLVKARTKLGKDGYEQQK